MNKLFEQAKTGDLSNFKKRVEKIPLQALAFITAANIGCELPDKEVEVPSIKTKVTIPCKKLNLLSLAFTYSKNAKKKQNPIIQYLLEEKKLVSYKDLQLQGQSKNID